MVAATESEEDAGGDQQWRCAMSSADFDEAVRESWNALDEMLRGNSNGYQQLYSRRDDVTLGNPFGGFGRGWDGVVEQLDRAASYFQDGEATSIDTISQFAGQDLAYRVLIERGRARVGGSAEMSDIEVRVTCIYALEDEGWKLVHRHADPRVSHLPAEAVLRA
jgi:ketosteroid isomerase-like protein